VEYVFRKVMLLAAQKVHALGKHLEVCVCVCVCMYTYV
jgi:hypothetical protein